MAQIRKFEQDAIVDSTIAHIVSDKDDTVATLEATPEYASITQMANTIKDLNKQREILSEKSNSVEKELENAVEAFNEDVLSSSPIYKLEYNRYSYQGELGLRFNTDISNYSNARTIISNDIAIALLPKDAVNDINSIIERIADKFRIELGGS